MSWYKKYWDTIDQIYWNPSLVGLVSIPKRDCRYENDTIAIPKMSVRSNGSIYTRKGNATENAERMRRLEEPLNHIFDITFGIAPDDAIRKLFLAPLKFESPGPFIRLGREALTRYPEFANVNMTQQDALFVGEKSIVGVELKIGSKTWPGQMLKYIALIVAEEKLSGRRDQIGVVYITPQNNSDEIFRQLGGREGEGLPANFMTIVPKKQINRKLMSMIVSDKAHFEDAIQRVSIAHRSWQQMASDAADIADIQDVGSAAGQTLQNLMQGFADAIIAHTGCCPR